ncbi:DUF2797 domain-containing protein [Entomomonas asaccharolytica]|uniref:DUF2797 domain-containing protein n=1 Tax=Entomomonas asaccharolytica TaxID=2785331 RepID=A0A974NIE8_9GAMM|nr:DUF2797 domain-containing protein [Entomomonas asaccharolytica]QQP87194.1 DUF2797 domain-containing protein [Entomomonas asaccharolytica]
MHQVLEGQLQKMQVSLPNAQDSVVQYTLCLGEHKLLLNNYLGKHIAINFTGNIFCQACHKKTPKSYGQGYCYPCFIKSAQCDICIMSPEKCHYAAGTCRNPEWGEQFCMTDHIVYLANSSGLKVGITRASQIPTRWIDQGAKQAVPIFRVATRQQSGFMEDILREHVADKTNWRQLLKGEAATLDLLAERDRILTNSHKMIAKLQATFGIQAIQPIENQQVTELNYPVQQYPTKILSHNLDKQSVVQGKLLGIKGQYLMLDTGVINIRKYTAYQVTVSVQ